MENEKVFNWDAETFFRILTRANKLAQEHHFKYCRVSGLQGFEEVLASAQSDTAFVAVQTEDDGYMSLVNSPHTRRVKTVYLAMRYPITVWIFAARASLSCRNCFGSLCQSCSWRRHD